MHSFIYAYGLYGDTMVIMPRGVAALGIYRRVSVSAVTAQRFQCNEN